LLACIISNFAIAQQNNRSPSLSLGDAVVTGFSGTIVPKPALPLPPSRSAADLTFIDPAGPSARIFGLGRPGHIWDARLVQVPKRFDVLAKETGQVFGVALDDQTPPNIYLAATSVYGLHIVGQRPGQTERRKIGGPGTVWMDGQFGLGLQGDPGSIYRVDGKTGTVTLFTKIQLDGVPNPGPALGNLAYDAAHKQLFVSDLYTGMIHRIAIADGGDLGAPYDHGVTGRGAANLPPLPFNANNRPNIATPRFNAENPDSWGYAPPERRVWGLAVAGERLFYSARNGATAAGPQIWSVGIRHDGSFAADARWELDVPAQPGPFAVSDIAFSATGVMIVAQRAPVAGSYDYLALTRRGEPRVLRFALKPPNAPPSPGQWTPVPEEYAVGFAERFRNANGGVALGYGYDNNGVLTLGACEAAIWTTGQNLRNNLAMRAQLEPGGPLPVSGLQGSPVEALRTADQPPATSYFIDYDDKFDDVSAAGHMGSVRILTQPCPRAVADAMRPGTPGPTTSPPYVSGSCIGPDCFPPPDRRIDLAIKKTAGEVKFDPATLSWTVTFTLTVTNVGAALSPGNLISVNDPLPAGLTLTSASGAGWTCTGSVNCGYAFGSGVFNTGATLPPITIMATSKTPGSYVNCAAVGVPPWSGLHETTLSNNRDCVKVVFEYPPNDLTVDKKEASCAVDSICVVTITVTNNSSWPFVGTHVVSENSSPPITIGNTDLPCTPIPVTTPFTCPGTFTIAANSSQTFTITGMVLSGSVQTGTTTNGKNCVTVAGKEDCAPISVCGFSCHMTQNQIDKIKIEKTANSTECSPGGQCSYTFTISNVSGTTPTGIMPITFIDTMPAGAATFLPPATPMPWGCIPIGGGQVKCLHPPVSIPPGGQLTVMLNFTIAPGYNQPTLQNCSDFFIGQMPSGAPAAARQRVEARMDASTLRNYLQSRGVAMLSSTLPKPGPDDHSCTTVNIVKPVAETRVTPLTCAPGTARRGQECVPQTAQCRPPMVAGAVAGQCACPAGTVQRGRRCVPLVVCQAPQRLNAAGTACVCPEGTVQRGRTCVARPICKPPATLNRNGVCACPPNMLARGNSCVERPRPPGVTPGDIIRLGPRPGGDRPTPGTGRPPERPGADSPVRR